MSAYVIVETVVNDPEQYKRYAEVVGATIEAWGGRRVVSGGEISVLEGDWEPGRLVVLEFDDIKTAKRWYASEGYQAAKRLREGAAVFKMVVVQEHGRAV